MTVPIELDSPGTTLISVGDPSFFLTEYTSISFRPVGAPIMQGQDLKSFSKNEWRRLIAAKGDFKVLGITLETNKPVEHFESAWRRVF